MSRTSKGSKPKAPTKRRQPFGAGPPVALEPVQAAAKASRWDERSRLVNPGRPSVAWVVAVLVALVTFTTFLPTLQNEFVAWDDDKTLLDNPRYRGLGWTQLRWMWTTLYMGQYIPLTWMTFGADYLLWGMKPSGYHLTSLLLHTANAVVFYFLSIHALRLAMPGSIEREKAALYASAAFAALLFAIHPLRVESVAWATERRDVLSGLFYLLAILVYLRTCEAAERSRRGYWLSVALFACALLAKPMAVSLPVVLLILDVCPLRRLGGTVGWLGEHARRVYVEKLPFVLLAAAVSVSQLFRTAQLNDVVSLARLSVPGRLAVSAYGLSFYLWKTVMPLNLSPLYELPIELNPLASPFVLGYAVVLTITGLALALRRRLPGVLAAWLGYVVILLPVIGIVKVGHDVAADRYTYLSCLGWVLLLGGSLLWCWQAWRREQIGKPIGFLIVGLAISALAGLGVLTWKQVQVWHDSERLWAYTLSIDPKSSIAHNNLALLREGKPDEAIEHYRKALQLNPTLAHAHINLGNALASQGKVGEAIEHYQRALQIEPGAAEAHNNLGLAQFKQGKLNQAIEHLQQAVTLKPDSAEAHNNLGLVLAHHGTLDRAIEHYQQAVRLRPDFAQAHFHLGNALLGQDKGTEAIASYQTALGIRPTYAEAHNNWGAILMTQGRLSEAIAHFEQALQINPLFSEARRNLNAALSRKDK